MKRAVAFLVVALACRAGEEVRAPAAGVTASATAPPPVAPRAGVAVKRFPAPGSQKVLPDTPFYLTFREPVRLGERGFIRVTKKGASSASDAIFVGEPVRTEVIAGREFRVKRPVVLLDERTVEIRFRPGALEPGSEYAVTLDDGALRFENGSAASGLGDAESWRIATRPALPPERAELLIAADGSGDFFTLQGAVDSLPAKADRSLVLRLKDGVYPGITLITGRSNFTVRGNGRGRTVLEAENNEILQEKRGAAFRAVLGLEEVSNVVIEDLTVRNTTPQGGSQAEALRVDPGDKVILRNAEFISRQDTLLLTGRVYAERCRVEGNVDYVWGRGTAYFFDCDFHVVERAGWEVQARNPAATFGYVFVDSRLTAEPGISGHRLARIDAERFPASHVAYIDCRIGPHVAPEGFLVTPAGAPSPGVRFWESGSLDLAGRPLDTRQRDRASKRLGRKDAEWMRDPSHVLAGWVPGAGNSHDDGNPPPEPLVPAKAHEQ